MARNDEVSRYPDSELQEFKALIEKKLALAQEQITSLEGQILEVSENTEGEHGGDWVDDSSINSEIGMLNDMAIRQRKYVQDLHNALLRIQNKTYGICVLTGQLIDKRRLLAVPTTTKSLEAKNDQRKKSEERMAHRLTNKPYVKKSSKKKEPKIITKVRKKTNSAAAPAVDDEEEDEDLKLVDDDLPVREIDFDAIPDVEEED